MKAVATCLILLSMLILPHQVAAQSPAASFYPGMYPALTPSYAATLQARVDRGQQRFLLDPARVVGAFAQFIKWPARAASARVVSRQGARAQVSLEYITSRGRKLYVDLRLLGKQRKGLWSVVSARTGSVRITMPRPGAHVTSPVAVRGIGTAFEGAMILNMLDSGWHSIGQLPVTITGQQPTPFGFRLRFRAHGHYGIVRVSTDSPRDGRLLDVALVKVITE
jgi:hypothetical protein